MAAKGPGGSMAADGVTIMAAERVKQFWTETSHDGCGTSMAVKGPGGSLAADGL